MYHVNGDFGQVRLVSLMPLPQNTGLFSVQSVGWHRCNDRYCITRPQGGDADLVLITAQGRGVLRLKSREYSLTAGTVAFIPRGVPHSYFTPKDGLWEFYWMHPSGEAAAGFLNTVSKRGEFIAEFEPGYGYSQRMETLMALCTQHEPDFEWRVSEQVSALLHRMAVGLCAKPSPRSLSSRAAAYMEQHFREPVTLDEIAQSLFVSTAHFIRAFKKETGITPHQYLTEHRLLFAAQLLEFGDSRVEEIAAQVGFSSSSLFISNFRRRYGCTPLQYREMVSAKFSLDVK